jgi:hypothetical protein
MRQRDPRRGSKNEGGHLRAGVRENQHVNHKNCTSRNSFLDVPPSNFSSEPMDLAVALYHVYVLAEY